MIGVSFHPEEGEATYSLQLPISKSISNRVLILQALYPQHLQIDRHSESTDTEILKEALQKTDGTVDFGMAGTSVRFYLAYATIKGIPIRIDASGRGRERPVQALFQALRMLGGSWHFEGEEDHFPCRVKNGSLAGGDTLIDTSLSSQFATALMLSAPLCPHGIHAEFKGKRSSKPYLELTRKLMEELGLSLELAEDGFSVPHQLSLPVNRSISVERDWSSVAFVAQHLVTSGRGAIRLEGLQADSPQGDRQVLDYFGQLGLVGRIEGQAHLLRSVEKRSHLGPLRLDFSDCPDLSMSWATAAAAMGIESELSGLHTLPGKESDRLAALGEGLGQLANVVVLPAEGVLKIGKQKKNDDPVIWDSHNDHRLAMCGALIAGCGRRVYLSELDSVTKSFPDFIAQFERVGYRFKSFG
jgi:3-phosphoshikimate 1-carboxyvinyltransferase